MEQNRFQIDYDGFFGGTRNYGAIGMENLSSPLSDEPRRQEPLTAYHVLSTLPWQTRKPGTPFEMEEFAILTAKLSALCWQRYNGPIYLVTDPAGAEYVRSAGLDQVYDGVKILLPRDNWGIPADKFWASSKLLALRQVELPCVILDMDLIVWRPLPLDGSVLAAAHVEYLRPDVYPDLDAFHISPRYRFPPQWDRTALPLNTAILYMADENLRNLYTGSAIAFMQYERHTPDDGVRCMVFAEQRILGMCAAEAGIRPQTFLDFDRLGAHQDLITHTWSGKRLLKFDPEASRRFCLLCRSQLNRLNAELFSVKASISTNMPSKNANCRNLL